MGIKDGGGVLAQRGRVGQRRYGGRFFEEFLPALNGSQGIDMF